jgi:hypothetical protein
VPRVRDLLYRFRPAGAPGPASAAAVPVDRAADRAAELEPVFALLAETEEQCAALRLAARRDAEARTALARETSRRVVADARAACSADRAAASAAVGSRAEGERAAALADARREAGLLLARADSRTPEWADRVARTVGELLGVEPGVPGR